MQDLLLDEDLVKAVTEKHKKNHKTDIQFGMVIYTDGGCKLKYPLENEWVNLASYGVHGYIYVMETTKVGAGISGYKVTTSGYELKDNPMVDSQTLESWADYIHFTRSVLKTHETRPVTNIIDPTEPTAIASLTVTPFYYFNMLGGLRDATNQVGEMVGFTKAMEIVGRVQAQIPLTQVHLKSDSRYVLQRVSLRFQDIENNWCSGSSGQPLANVEYLKELTATLTETLNPKTLYTCEWIKGHQDSYGNIQADALATKGLVGACNGVFTEQFDIAPAKGYWASLKKNTTADRPEHYLLVDQLWYHNTQASDEPLDNGQYPICLGTHETIGQPNSEYGMAIALLNERPETFKRLIDISLPLDKIANGLDTHGVFTVPVNEVLKPVNRADIDTYGADYLKVNQPLKVISSIAKKDILTRITPTECALDHMDRFDQILQVLDRARRGELFPHEVLNDVTDRVYKTRGEGKKRKTELTIGNDSGFRLEVVTRTYDSNHVYRDKTYTVTLTHGITAPKKRVLSGLKEYNVKVYVLTSFEAFAGFRFYTLIQLDSGEWGIWTNPYANLRNI